MPAAKITAAAKVVQLDRQPRPDEQVTERDVQEPKKLARLLTQMLKDIARLLRRYSPRRIDFEDVAIPATGLVPLAHRFNGRVRWWVVDWQSTAANKAPVLTLDPSTNSNTLVLSSAIAGTATIRVEESG